MCINLEKDPIFLPCKPEMQFRRIDDGPAHKHYSKFCRSELRGRCLHSQRQHCYLRAYVAEVCWGIRPSEYSLVGAGAKLARRNSAAGAPAFCGVAGMAHTTHRVGVECYSTFEGLTTAHNHGVGIESSVTVIRSILLPQVLRNALTSPEIVSKRGADIGSERKASVASEGRALSGKGDRLKCLSSVAAGYKNIHSDVEAL